MNWTASLIALGAVVATTSALVPYQAGQPRIFFSMARDGLLPPWAARVHPRFRTPHVTTLLTGIVVAVCSSIANINELVELTNIGTLFAFVLVASGIVFYGLKAAVGIRLSPEQELMGSDFAEHGMWGYPEHFVGPDDGSDGTTLADRLREPVIPQVVGKPTPAET